ncbi:S-layer homology domain-containing protein, partial [Micrococcus sp. SIMBA_144]
DLDGSSAPESGFTDVPERARESVNILKQQGIINGKTDVKFGAEDTLTRGEMAIILSRAYSLSGSSTLSFTDVGDRYLDAVQAMVYN